MEIARGKFKNSSKMTREEWNNVYKGNFDKEVEAFEDFPKNIKYYQINNFANSNLENFVSDFSNE